ncbi:MAG: FMN-binding protein [Prevotellaceae bacterium]|jgi:Na+-translocating ferredoxin:NAD+ oxidoreductase RnfG subunit|nr:FMN-binding protein [Prevotellaceae bacterium]
MKRNFYKRLPVVVLFFVLAMQQGSSAAFVFSPEQLKRLFPEGATTQPADTSEYLVFDRTQQKIGRAILSSPSADNIVGFFGPVPLLIGIDLKGNITGVLLLENRETAEYVVQVENSGLLSQWDGLPAKEALEKQVDAVSGATLTSKAVIRTFQKRVSEDVQSHSGTGFSWIILFGGIVVLVALSLISKMRSNKKE